MGIVVPVLTRLLSALCALALVGLGGLIVVEVIANWTGNGFQVLPTDWPTQLRSTSWDAVVVRNSLLVALTVGVVLLLVSLWRRPPLTIHSNQDGMQLERHALEVRLRRRLDALDGVTGSRVRIDRNRVRATIATTRRLAPESVRDRADEELSAFCALHDLRLTPDVTLHVQDAPR